LESASGTATCSGILVPSVESSLLNRRSNIIWLRVRIGLLRRARFEVYYPINLPVQKKGGVCSIRQYRKEADSDFVEPIGKLRAICPNRFLQAGTIFKWVGETLLGTSFPIVLSQIRFFERPKRRASGAAPKPEDYEAVGRIDHVLVHPSRKPLDWCALEIQAVYFSGKRMLLDIERIRSHSGSALPFPTETRRPDYRSSGVKRLLPQLLLKVDQLRRWEKKMAVVVDGEFFRALGEMDEVPGNDLSSCDIVWFPMEFEESGSGAVLIQGTKHLTTLEKAREGLAGGRPVSKQTFEQRIRDKLIREHPDAAATLDLSQ